MNQIEHKPWGSYEVLLDEPNYKVKRIVVDAYQRFSLQYHKHREEHWVIVGGSGTVEIKGREFVNLTPSFSILIFLLYSV